MQAITREFKKLLPLMLFFFIGFGYILVVMKLVLKEYSIDTSMLSKAVIGALVAAKAVAIIDLAPWLDRFHRFPRYINVLYKTSLYTVAVLILGSAERIIDAYSKTKALGSAIEMFMKTENFYQFLAIVLCVILVFLIHNIFKEIDLYLGKGKLFSLFFDRP